MPCKKRSGLANDRRAYYYSNCMNPTPSPPTPSPCSLLPQETPYQLCSPWPQIGGLDNSNSRYTPIIGSQTGNVNLLKTIDLIILNVSSPTIASDGTIYICINSIGTDKNIQGFIISFYSNGTIKWTYTLIPGDIFTVFSINNVASPTIGKDGILYVGSNLGYVYAINPDKTTKWYNQYQLNGNNGYISMNMIIGTDDNIYFGLNGTNSDTSLLSVQSSDGVEKWRYDLHDINSIIPDSVAIDKYNNIYFAYETGIDNYKKLNYVVCLDNVGNKLWICDINNNNNELMNLLSRPTLSVDNSRLYILNNYRNNNNNPPIKYYLNAINTENGIIDSYQSITIMGSNGFSGPSLNSIARDLNDNLYFSINDPVDFDITLYSVNKGTINWIYKIPTPSLTTNAILTTPSICSDGTIYFGLFFFSFTDKVLSINNYMYAINPNKTTKWIKLLPNTSTTLYQTVMFTGFSINLQGNIIIPCNNITTTGDATLGINLYLLN